MAVVTICCDFGAQENIFHLYFFCLVFMVIFASVGRTFITSEYILALIYENGALGRPRGMEWGGRREEGSGWGTHVYLWQIHFDIWQN